MVEPVSLTLAVVSLLQPTFNVCRTLHRNYKNAKSFGQDYTRLNRDYNIQVARLAIIAEQKLEFMELKINPDDQNDTNAQFIKQKLDAISDDLETCRGILDYFDHAKKNEQPNGYELGIPQTIQNGLSDSSLQSTEQIIGESSLSQSDSLRGQTHREKGKTRWTPSYDTSRASVKSLAEKVTEFAHDWHGKGHHAKMSLLWLHASKRVTEALKNVRDGVQDLELFIKYRPPQSADPSEEVTSTIKSLRAVREAVRKLHINLLGVNRRAKRSPFEIAIKLEENPEGVGRALESVGVAMRNGHFAFPIMIHDEGDKEPALSVVAEIDPSAPPSSTNEADGFESINELRRILLPAFTSIGGSSYNPLGCIRQPPNPEHVHLFHNSRAKYFRLQSLADVLGTQDFRNHLNASKRLKLAILLSHAYLYFARVVDNKADIRPSEIYLYGNSTQSGWDLSSGEGRGSYLSRLFICIGFGEANVDFDVAMESVNGRSALTNSVEELGVLLFQVAVCGKIDYKQETNGLSLAKDIARKGMNDVDKSICGTMSEIISACLSWKPKIDSRESRMLESVFCRLKKVEEEFTPPENLVEQ